MDRHPRAWWRCFTAVIGLFFVASLSTAVEARAQFPPEELTNLEVFPEDISVRELIGHMRGFAMGLGVRCEYCHVGEPGQDLSTFDFTSDEKPTKRKARTMLRMTQAINATHLAELEDHSDSTIQVTCATCHHGLSKPRTLQAVLTATAQSDGVQAAIEEYQRLREEYYGTYSYDFSEGALTQVAQALVASDIEGAIEVLKFNLELFPQSLQTHVMIGQAYGRAGDTESAIRFLERALELSPGNQFIQQQLDRIRGN